MIQHLVNHATIAKACLELGSVTTIITYWMGFLTPGLALTATTASLVWYCFNIYTMYQQRRTMKLSLKKKKKNVVPVRTK